MTADLEKEIDAPRKLRKPKHELTFDQICKMVNGEQSKLERDFTSADLWEIHQKLGFPSGASFDASVTSDFLQFGERSED
tara:strand:- start:1113 stop:1352 length:240 start_codon:yes stop_codon:yes gene_type:complete